MQSPAVCCLFQERFECCPGGKLVLLARVCASHCTLNYQVLCLTLARHLDSLGVSHWLHHHWCDQFRRNHTGMTASLVVSFLEMYFINRVYYSLLIMYITINSITYTIMAVVGCSNGKLQLFTEALLFHQYNWWNNNEPFRHLLDTTGNQITRNNAFAYRCKVQPVVWSK